MASQTGVGRRLTSLQLCCALLVWLCGFLALRLDHVVYGLWMA